MSVFESKALQEIFNGELQRLQLEQFPELRVPFHMSIPKHEPSCFAAYRLAVDPGSGYALFLHDEITYTSYARTRPQILKGHSMTKKQTTIESTTQPSTRYGAKPGTFEHTAKAKYGQPFISESLIGKATSETSMAAAAEQLVLDLETAAREARAAFEAAGLVKPLPKVEPVKPTGLANLLAARLAKDLGAGQAVGEEILADVKMYPHPVSGNVGRCVETRTTFTSPNGTKVMYTSKCDAKAKQAIPNLIDSLRFGAGFKP